MARIGALMGAAVGDAIGAPLEFIRRLPTEAEVQSVLCLPGGGYIGVEPGQTTDDNELASALYWALKGNRPLDGFPFDDVAQAYHEWYGSKPLDCGKSCAAAFTAKVGSAMLRAAAKVRKSSQSNGALMRCIPIPVWSIGEDSRVVAHFAQADCSMTHPGAVAREGNAAYCVAVHHLLRHHGDYRGAHSVVVDFATESCDTIVADWVISGQEPTDCLANIGHMKHGFVLALECLRKNLPFEDAILHALRKGGDTDTNASIVGGMMGALHGIDKIPEQMLSKVLGSVNNRPAKYTPRSVFEDFLKKNETRET